MTGGCNHATVRPVFTRSGSTMSSLDGPSADLALRGRKSRGAPFLVLAAGLLFFAAAVGVAFIMLRPTTLRIAVGPSGSDDQQLIQALAQNFASESAGVRLTVIPTAGPVDSLMVGCLMSAVDSAA